MPDAIADPGGSDGAPADGDGRDGAVPAPSSDRVRLRRLAEQGSHRVDDLHAVLDAGFVCHLGVLVGGAPMVVPTTYARDGDSLYVHGSAASRSLRAASRDPAPVCVTVTHVDGLVIARSLFNHSVNYRCAMVYGIPEWLTGSGEKLAGLRAIAEHVAPGQWAYARLPSAKELAATTVLRLALDEASVKVSEGPPDDGGGPDGELDVWAGELPLVTIRLDPRADPALRPGIPCPEHLTDGRPAPGSVHHPSTF